MSEWRSSGAFTCAVVLAVLLAAGEAAAHCDTLDGPLVKDAQAAFASGEVGLVLKWVAPDAEATVRDAFRRASAVRALGPEASELAERYFLETLVRLHREGEGEPYTGLKPSGTELAPGIVAADEALASGSVESLARTLAAQVEQGLRERFSRAAEAKKHAPESLERGRAYVSAYVEFMHYTERLSAASAAPRAQAGSSSTPHRH